MITVIRIITKKGFTVPPLDTDGEEEDKGEGDEAAAVTAAGDDGEAAAEGEGGAEPPKDGPRSRRGTGSDAPPPTYNERQLSKPSQAAASAKAAESGRQARPPRAPPARSVYETMNVYVGNEAHRQHGPYQLQSRKMCAAHGLNPKRGSAPVP